MKTNLKQIFLTLLLVPVLCVFMSSCAHADLPPFDYKKAKQLTPEKRREYDVVFFNEVLVWNMNSNRYGPGLMDSNIGRDAEFRRMAGDGYLPAYVALRLLDIVRGSERNDPEAVAMLLKAADEGDASAMCAFGAIPINSLEESSYAERSARGARMVERGFALGHPACMAYRGGDYLSGNVSAIPKNTKAAMPLLLESARQGYYVAARSLFGLRYGKALARQFDFTDLNELKRALCWGRLAEQHTNWASFDYFLGLLKDYVRINDRPDLLALSAPYDPRLVPITQTVVKPETCIQLEQGE
ncbi:MAG: sel1 repeat family protein [Gallionella sp.]|nr:MAG: sel1 repeat family protein [Gallionella sp.]